MIIEVTEIFYFDLLTTNSTEIFYFDLKMIEVMEKLLYYHDYKVTEIFYFDLLIKKVTEYYATLI